MGILDLFRRRPAPAAPPIPETTKIADLPGELSGRTSERGLRAHPEAQLAYAYRRMWVDPDLRSAIIDIRRMDRLDGRVKKVHSRTARAAAKGGIRLQTAEKSKRLQREWEEFARALHLYRREKLESDLRGLMMEGNLPLQWILDGDQRRLVGCARMPAETIVPRVTEAGRFEDVTRAYEQWDLSRGIVIASYPLYALTVARLQPDNYDDWGSLGRPYLDATRTVWRKLQMTEEDLVIRRTMRAPLRMVHVLEGADEPTLAEYRAGVERDQAQGNYTDYYLNKKGSVTPVAGDANLEQIADVAHLLDTFFAGAPAPKGLFGYVGDLARDVLEDLKRDFYDEIDAMQDNVAYAYEQGFRLQLLLKGINPDAFDYTVQFAERRTDTPNQRADLALKLQALGASKSTVLESAGLEVQAELKRIEDERANTDPYPEPGEERPPDDGESPDPRSPPRVSVTPGNARKGESATDISTTRGTA